MPTSCCMVLYILCIPQLTLSFRRPQQCLEWWFSVVDVSFRTQSLVCEKSEILFMS
jgi:hypothetical protein